MCASSRHLEFAFQIAPAGSFDDSIKMYDVFESDVTPVMSIHTLTTVRLKACRSLLCGVVFFYDSIITRLNLLCDWSKIRVTPTVAVFNVLSHETFAIIVFS